MENIIWFGRNIANGILVGIQLAVMVMTYPIRMLLILLGDEIPQ